MRIEFILVLREVPDLWSNVMTYWMSLIDGGCTTFGIRLRENVLADDTWYMTSIAWHVLHLDLVRGSCDPVSSVFAPVTIDFLLELALRSYCLPVETVSLSAAEWCSVLSPAS